MPLFRENRIIDSNSEEREKETNDKQLNSETSEN
jgi:hypothetical protein